MKNRTFFWFILPSLVAMILFIALPIGSVFIQSLYIEHGAVLKEVKSCGPFGCKEEVQIDIAATSQLKEEKPLGKFNGFGTYTNRNHLAINEVKDAWNGSANWSNYFNQIYNLPFYRALAFTLTYTFIVTPLVLLLGFFIALGVNNLPKNTIDVYPNPTNDFLTVRSLNGHKIKQVMLFDLYGKLLMNTNENILDLNSLNNGIYFLKVFTSNRIEELEINGFLISKLAFNRE